MNTRPLWGLVGVLLTGISLHAAEPAWLTDLARAQEQARGSNKLILAHFTGSDWCTLCTKQERDIFNTPAFAGYARSNLVLLKVDFPRKGISAEKQARNNKLKERYRIQNFPTLLLLDAKGRELNRWVGYPGGGAG
jgi:protein disulfide-isomerase